ncbi:MAG: nickel-dependent hydrogenase large subunit [Candidatus Omnitrophica bacterium]|nr:nickel-dependent hydrogenase large subunit [Candidatus Omnitrophota bacterium]MCM8802121.1 nickel-dependent hydrogenase large subunit [Candidatus Omnitrophota bacterium]
MRKKIIIDPVTRIEGHLKIEVEIEDKKVVDAKCSGMLYRGIENILIDRDPTDAVQITQRVCGVCPIAHATASTYAVEDALGIKEKIPQNAYLVRNLIHASNHIHNSILHFYHLCLLDFIDLTKVKRGVSSEIDLVCKFFERDNYYPFSSKNNDLRLPEDVNLRCLHNYIKGLEIRRYSHQLLSIFGGKMPHQCGIIPGGVTQKVDIGKIENAIGKLKDIKEFVELYYFRDLKDIINYYNDYFDIGASYGNYLAYGTFYLKKDGIIEKFQPGGVVFNMESFEEFNLSEITEHIENSWYEGEIENPGKDFPKVDINKNAYSWIKSPRYKGKPFEVGPVARLFVAYKMGVESWKSQIDKIITDLKIDIKKLNSVLGRHIARFIEAKVLIEESLNWILKIKEDEEFFVDYEIPSECKGVGLSEGARGAVGHWIEIKNKKISHYQIISPTTWNASPKDKNENYGPIEKALIGTTIKDEENPIEILRIVRSFDPCLACAVQIIERKKLNKKEFLIWA